MSEHRSGAAPAALTLGDAQALMTSVLTRAGARGHEVCVTVVDAAGFAIGKARSDGASRLTVGMSEAKAWTAAMLDMPTDELQSLVQPGAPLYGLNVADAGRVVVIGGGVPVHRNSQVIGGLGVAGASPGDDAATAHAAIEQWTQSRPSTGSEPS